MREQPRRRGARPWWLPLLLLALAALACDGPNFDPLQVRAVEADPVTPGRAYARVGNQNGSAIYMTDNYGATWQQSDYQFSTGGTPPSNALQLTMVGDRLQHNGQTIWTFPRATFREFFLDDVAGEYFQIPSWGSISNSYHADTLYVAMGTEGVLVGPLPGQPVTREWELTHVGIDGIDPLPLTVTNPVNILIVVLLGISLPPLWLLHTFILRRVWVYLLPLADARRLARRVALALTGLAALAIVVWLTNPATQFYGVVLVMTAVVVAVDVAVTLWLLRRRRRGLTRWQVGALVAVIVLVSLIVPAGVASIWMGWWAVFTLLSGYWFYHQAYTKYFEARTRIHLVPAPPHWLIDRITLETLLVLVSVLTLTVLFIAAYSRVVGDDGLGYIIGFVVFVTLATSTLKVYTRLRVYRYAAIDPDSPEATSGTLTGNLIVASGLAPLVAFAGSVGLFIGQMMAYGWFTAMLLPR